MVDERDGEGRRRRSAPSPRRGRPPCGLRSSRPSAKEDAERQNAMRPIGPVVDEVEEEPGEKPGDDAAAPAPSAGRRRRRRWSAKLARPLPSPHVGGRARAGAPRTRARAPRCCATPCSCQRPAWAPPYSELAVRIPRPRRRAVRAVALVGRVRASVVRAVGPVRRLLRGRRGAVLRVGRGDVVGRGALLLGERGDDEDLLVVLRVRERLDDDGEVGRARAALDARDLAEGQALGEDAPQAARDDGRRPWATLWSAPMSVSSSWPVTVPTSIPWARLDWTMADTEELSSVMRRTVEVAGPHSTIWADDAVRRRDRHPHRKARRGRPCRW